MFVLSALALSLAAGLAALPPVMGVDGKLHAPLAEARGKPNAFLFISYDCPICNTYAPKLSRIEAKYGAKIAIHIVYVDARLTPSAARRHAKAYGIGNATLLLDPNCGFAAACGATVTPQAIVFDAKGREAYSGRIDDWYYALGRQRPAPTTHDLTNALDAVLVHESPMPAAGPPVGCILILPHKP